MSRRKLVIAGTLAGLMALAAQVPAGANVAWCVYDPPVQLVTPGGHHLVINNYVYLSPDARHLASHLEADATAAPDGFGGTSVTVQIYVPPGIGAVHVVSANHRYQVSKDGDGSGGTVLTLILDVPID